MKHIPRRIFTVEFKNEANKLVTQLQLQLQLQIGHSDERKSKPRRYGKMWGIPTPWYAFIWPLTQKWGEKSYATNIRRKERAMSVSRGKESVAP